MKKRVCIFVLVMMLLLTVSVTALAACSHPGREDLGSVDIFMVASSSGHTYYNVEAYDCPVCGYYEQTVKIGTSSHSYVIYIRDLGHVANTTTHKYTAGCDECDYTTTKTYTCSGNPCRYPF